MMQRTLSISVKIIKVALLVPVVSMYDAVMENSVTGEALLFFHELENF